MAYRKQGVREYESGGALLIVATDGQKLVEAIAQRWPDWKVVSHTHSVTPDDAVVMEEWSALLEPANG